MSDKTSKRCDGIVRKYRESCILSVSKRTDRKDDLTQNPPILDR